MKKFIKWRPITPQFKKTFAPENIYTGNPILYQPGTLTDCRSAYGQALLDLAKANPRVLALSADISESVKTSYVRDNLPKQHIEAGIAEQQMVSCAGGLSLSGFIPFCSTLGAFLVNRAKDQIRANDINETNVKVVATHCGLSVGEDGPTHQVVDDLSTIAGLFHTQIIEPADPNHCDRIIRYVASKYGNFYVRMGRHKVPILTKEDGSPFYGTDYVYEYGNCDILRAGTSLTVVVSGSLAGETLKAYNLLKNDGLDGKAEIIIASSIKKFTDNLVNSLQKTGRVLTIEDHNSFFGLGTAVADLILEKTLTISRREKMGVVKYMTSGTAEDLYSAAGLSSQKIAQKISEMLKG
jgi:transketolase